MALINCPECNSEVSDKAISCPKCGCPIASPSTQDITPVQPEEPTTIQATQKSFKGTMLAGSIVCGIGFACFIAKAPGPGVFFIVLGFIVYFSGRFGAWWSTG